VFLCAALLLVLCHATQCWTRDIVRRAGTENPFPPWHSNVVFQELGCLASTSTSGKPKYGADIMVKLPVLEYSSTRTVLTRYHARV